MFTVPMMHRVFSTFRLTMPKDDYLLSGDIETMLATHEFNLEASTSKAGGGAGAGGRRKAGTSAARLRRLDI